MLVKRVRDINLTGGEYVLQEYNNFFPVLKLTYSLTSCQIDYETAQLILK